MRRRHLFAFAVIAPTVLAGFSSVAPANAAATGVGNLPRGTQSDAVYAQSFQGERGDQRLRHHSTHQLPVEARR